MQFYYDHDYGGRTTEDVLKIELGLDVMQAMDWENGTTWSGTRTVRDEERAENYIYPDAGAAQAIASEKLRKRGLIILLDGTVIPEAAFYAVLDAQEAAERQGEMEAG
jgi:hypothetical protein